MTTLPTRIVDAHVHLWDPARTDWYPYLGGDRDLGMGDVSGMARRFDLATYRAEVETWPVAKVVNVAAATGRHSVAETLELDRLEHHDAPAALVGGLPPAASVAETIDRVDEQMQAARFRGVRTMDPSAPAVPDDDVLRALTERQLVFELMAHPPDLVAAAQQLAAHPELTVVVEHTGWPRSTDDDERARWAEGIAALAGAGPHVHCKLSGLAMPLRGLSAQTVRPWLEPAIEAFGVDRCMFASNFPVDGLHTSLAQLWTVYTDVTGEYREDEVDLLYAANAERVYRC